MGGHAKSQNSPAKKFPNDFNETFDPFGIAPKKNLPLSVRQTLDDHGRPPAHFSLVNLHLLGLHEPWEHPVLVDALFGDTIERSGKIAHGHHGIAGVASVGLSSIICSTIRHWTAKSCGSVPYL